MTVGAWRDVLSQAPRANWMQSWPYAQASFLRDQKSTRLALIRDRGGPVGAMALQEIKLGPVHLLNLNRGPLWFVENPSQENLDDFSGLFNEQFPRKLFRRRRWMPEWDRSEPAKNLLQGLGFHLLPQTYETIWMDLTKSEVELRLNLKQKWRNGLHKSERAGLEVISDWQGKNLDLFLQNYEKHKAQKRYSGPTSLFVKEEFRNALPFGDALLLWAHRNSEPIAGIMILLHGQTASYRVGWNTLSGRSCNAHYLLLWQSLQILKVKGLRAFDLGGIKPGEAEGLTRFKQGLGGIETPLLGFFR